MKNICKKLAAIFAAFALSSIFAFAQAPQKKLVLVAGNSIHLWGDHENLLMCQTLGKLLQSACKNIDVKIVNAGGGEKLSEIGEPDGVIIIGEGEDNHPLKDCPQLLARLCEKKIGVGVFHYSLHFSNPEHYRYLDKAVGGHYEPHWSVNPFWVANFKLNNAHPIARGVRPFTIDDEWYFNIRFTSDTACKITPVLFAAPPDKVRNRRFGAHTGNPTVRAQKGKEEVILWTIQNPNGSRGFGFAGGHSVWDFAQKDFRKLLVNAAAWLVGEEIPENGFDTKQPSYEELKSAITKQSRGDCEDYCARWLKFFKENAE